MTAVQTAPPEKTVGSAPGFKEAYSSEMVKIRSVRSTYWTLSITAVLGILLGFLICLAAASRHVYNPDPTVLSLRGLELSQLAVAVFGVLIATSEFSTGAILSSLAAVPNRIRFIMAKAAALVSVTFVVAEVTAFLTFLVGQATLSGSAASASLGQPGVLRAVIGAGLYITLLGLFGMALGVALRSTAGAIAVVVAAVFLVPIIAAFLPSSIGNGLEKWWPTNAGTAVFYAHRATDVASPWAGFFVFVALVAVLLVLAVYSLMRRDV